MILWNSKFGFHKGIEMLSLSGGPQRLRIKRPTQSTVLFTVSTASATETVTEKASLYLSHCIRLSFVLSVLGLFYAKWQLLSAGPDTLVPGIFLQSSLGQTALSITKDLDWRYLLAVGLLVLWLSVRRGYTGMSFDELYTSYNIAGFEDTFMRPLLLMLVSVEESLLVLRGLGVQTSSSSPTYLATASTKFIPTTRIQDIFIHEAFKGFEVRFYLAIVVEGEEDVVVVFPVR